MSPFNVSFRVSVVKYYLPKTHGVFFRKIALCEEAINLVVSSKNVVLNAPLRILKWLIVFYTVLYIAGVPYCTHLRPIQLSYLEMMMFPYDEDMMSNVNLILTSSLSVAWLGSPPPHPGGSTPSGTPSLQGHGSIRQTALQSVHLVQNCRVARWEALTKGTSKSEKNGVLSRLQRRIFISYFTLPSTRW